jgi:DNA-binding NarL/FixJ family response regulator
MMTKLFIVDDHHMVIEGLHSMLREESSIEWMGHATNAVSCMAFLASQQPDIILMDIHLQDSSGIDLCKDVKALYPSIFVIGLSTFNQYSFIQKMMENGASGYLLKNATRGELMEAFKTVLKGKQYLSHDAGRMLNKNEGPMLTRREREVLVLIAEGMTNQEIADKLFVSSTTVITHRKNLLFKFNTKNTATLIKAAAQMKLI